MSGSCVCEERESDKEIAVGRTNRRQIADKMQTNRRQIADKTQTKRRKITDKSLTKQRNHRENTDKTKKPTTLSSVTLYFWVC